jgi:hypothetical protein
MDMSISDVIGTASLLFALVGLLGTFFFVSLTQWLSGVLANRAAWNVIVARNPNKKEFGSRVDCYYKAKESRSWATVVAWFVITAFLAFIMYKLVILMGSVKADGRPMIESYVVGPCGLFFIVYLVLSLAFMVIGFWKSSEVIRAFESTT